MRHPEKPVSCAKCSAQILLSDLEDHMRVCQDQQIALAAELSDLNEVADRKLRLGAALAEQMRNVQHLYSSLQKVLIRAQEQAAQGKGRERHATENEPFDEQQIVKIGIWLGNTGFQVGQAVKKALESQRLPKEQAVAELLGAINYLAAAVLVRERLP